MNKTCPPELNAGATLLIVGEAPGQEEIAAQRPFVGRSGQLLDAALRSAKIDRKKCNVVNVCHHRPPDNDISKFFPKGKPNEFVLRGVDYLQRFIDDTRPTAILALGNTALWALTGHREISDRRGSVYAYKGIPVVAAMHPAAILRKPQHLGLLVFDLSKFRIVAAGEYPQQLDRRIVINPTDAEVQDLRRLVDDSKWVSVDIETHSGELACVGWGLSPTLAWSVPSDTPARKAALRDLLLTDTPKIFHNAPFDYPYLVQKEGYEINGEIHDTLAMSQALYPELPRSLGCLTSLYTSTPYYKDAGEDWLETHDWDKYWWYNGMDCAVTIEIAEALRARLEKAGLWDVYEATRKILPHALQMSMRGIKYDSEVAARLRDRSTRWSARRLAVLGVRAGHEVNPNSPLQIKKLLKERKINVPDTKQATLISIYPMLAKPEQKLIRSLLRARETDKFLGTYLNAKPSSDGRMRTTLNPAGTETGRWTAGKYLITEGTNLQTVPPEWKPCFVADEGMYLWMADYSQIEARLVAYLAGDEKAIAIFNDPKGDIHKENAALIFKVPFDEVTSVQRSIVKNGVHALNYDVQENTLLKTINRQALETGVWVDRQTVRAVRQAYITKFDRVVAWQERTWQEVKKTRRSVNPFGRRRIFTGPVSGPGSEHTRKEAIANVPQSTVPDLLNKALDTLCNMKSAPGFEVFLNIHDALMGQGPIADAETWVPKIREAMQIPFVINHQTVTIPVEIKIGKRWSELKKV